MPAKTSTVASPQDRSSPFAQQTRARRALRLMSAVVSAVECERVALIAPPADVSLRARRALVCCAKGDDRSWGDAAVELFAGIDAAAPPAGVVRALCAFVSQ